MTTKTIEAILRLATDVAPALAGLRQLRKEATAATAPVAATAADSTQQRRATKEATDAARQATAVQQAELAKQRQADRVANAQALADKKAALRAQREAEAQSRREQRRTDDEAERERRRVAAANERERLRTEAAAGRARREEQRKLTQVAPQVSDIVTGLVSGQNPGIVALQQGLQLRDIFGSARGAASALLSVVTPIRVVIAGAAGAAGLLAFNILAGTRESDQLRKSLALTGNAAGTSLGQIDQLAKGIATQVQVPIGLARDAVAALISVQGQTQATLGATGRAVSAVAKLTGQSAEEAVKGFEDQANGITDWSVKANRAYNFLTPAQVAHIRALEQQGRITEAIRLVNNELAQTLEQRTAPALGALDRAWGAVTRTVSSFIDQLRAIGRDSTPEERLKKLQDRLDEIRRRQAQPLFAGRRSATDNAEAGNIQVEIGTINRDLARRTEGAIEAQQREREIAQQSIENQQSLTAVTLAEASKRTAGILAELDQRQAAVELADARGLTSERDKALALNRIDQDRLRAQLALQQAQAAEAGRLVQFEKSEQAVRAAQARVTEAEAQITTTRGRLQAAIAEAQRITEADALAQSRDRAKQWADIWTRAEQQVRGLERQNLETLAAREGDPLERARKAAEAATDELRRSLQEGQRDLRVQIALAISPNSAAELRAQLGGLILEGKQAVDELTRRTTQDSLRNQLGDQLQALQLQEQALAAEVERGALTTEQAEARKFAAREAALPQLRQLLELLKNLATTDGEKNAVQGLLLQLDQVADKTTELQRVFRSAAQSSFATLFNDIATGAERVDRALGNMVANFARRMLELLQQRLAEKLINSATEALKGFQQQNAGSGGIAGAFASIISSLIVGNKHSGGLIGGAMTAARTVSPLLFAGAQVLHSGGLVLGRDEVPLIGKVGEEMLTEDDPRHRKNFRAGPLIGTLNLSVSLDGVSGDDQLARRVAGLLTATVQQTLADELRPGGMLYRES